MLLVSGCTEVSGFVLNFVLFEEAQIMWERQHREPGEMRKWWRFSGSTTSRLHERRSIWCYEICDVESGSWQVLEEDASVGERKIQSWLGWKSKESVKYFLQWLVSSTSLWVLVKEIHRWWCWSHKKKKAEIKQEAFDRRWMFLTVLKKPVKGWCKLIVFHKNQLVCDSAIMS